MYKHTRSRGFNTAAGVVLLLTLALAGCGGGGNSGMVGVSGGPTGGGIGAGGTGTGVSGGGTGTGVSGGGTGTGVSGGGTGTTVGGGGSTGGSGGATTYTATAIVLLSGVPQPGVTVTVSSGGTSSPPSAGSVIATQVTDQLGQAVFPGLTKGANYCFTASYTNNTGAHQAISCSNTSDTTVLLTF
jgi:hypothetical protein